MPRLNILSKISLVGTYAGLSVVELCAEIRVSVEIPTVRSGDHIPSQVLKPVIEPVSHW